MPLGPCLVEPADNDLADIVWGAEGQNSTSLAVESIGNAANLGHLVLVD